MTIKTFRSRSTRTLVSVVDNRDGSFDAGEPVYHEDGTVTENVVVPEIRWASICEEHNTYIHSGTRALAEEAARYPAEWCEECRESVGD